MSVDIRDFIDAVRSRDGSERDFRSPLDVLVDRLTGNTLQFAFTFTPTIANGTKTVNRLPGMRIVLLALEFVVAGALVADTTFQFQEVRGTRTDIGNEPPAENVSQVPIRKTILPNGSGVGQFIAWDFGNGLALDDAKNLQIQWSAAAAPNVFVNVYGFHEQPAYSRGRMHG